MFTKRINKDLSLALIQPAFAKQYAALVTTQTAYLAQWLAWPKHCHTEQHFREFAQKMLHDYADGTSMTCSILYKGEIVGNCSFNRIDHSRKMVEVGYWLSCHHQGKGIMTQVVSKLIDIAFNELQMEKVQLAAAENNTPSRNLATRVGMSLEGIITHAENINGQILNHAIYGIHKQSYIANSSR
ncbi:GNAT family N-acetyltransferase [Vibrio sp. NTOU-M3]|uniref:GNAT family N-acetyltransferase n=1 Tax=Vibrio sp. NTOU-M3 TaxID=3234954 RepID=UPI00349F5E27